MNADINALLKKYISSGDKFRIKLLGDSITHGCGGTDFLQSGESIIGDYRRNPDGYCWANLFKEYMESRYNCEVVNNGCAGVKIEFIIENYDTLVDENDDIIICMIGTNNRAQRFDTGPRRDRDEYLQEFYSNIVRLYQRPKSENRNFFFMVSIPSLKEEDGPEFWRIFHMNDVNDAYKKAAKECGFTLVSLYDLFTDYCNQNNVDMNSLLYDRLHPNDDGYKVMFELLIHEFGLV